MARLNKQTIEALRDMAEACEGELVGTGITLLLEWHDRNFDLVAHLTRQRTFSEKTFGPGARTKGVIDHIRKELAEIEADPTDLAEWVDVIILAFDGAWRAGWEPEAIIKAIVAKQAKNEARTWPDWRTADPEKAIEHDRSGEVPLFTDMHCEKCGTTARPSDHSVHKWECAECGCWHDVRLSPADSSLPWCLDMASAPRNARILVLSDPGGEVYAAHWVQHPGTGDEAWLISESSDGSQHLCKAKAWAPISAMPEMVNG